jgi:glyoxylate reductase
MPKIFVTRPIPELGLDILKAKGWEVVVNEAANDRPATHEEVIAGVKGCDALLSVLTEKIDGEVMDAGLPTLKIVANYAVGFDNIDLKAAAERNITITNTPGALTNTVAEHAFALLLSVAHRVSEAERFTRAGMYKAWGPKMFLGEDLSGKTMGIVGLGRIGSRVAYHAVKGFDMKVLYTDVKPNADFEKELGATFVTELKDLLPQCDFVSIHVPLLDSTRHLFNADTFKLMKPSAYLVNTSRGPIIDEKALADALKNNVIKGAGIDVFEFEPQITQELLSLENIVMTPHIASATHQTRSGMSEIAAKNIIEVLEGRPALNPVK